MARDQRAAALKAWATRRARAGGKARILPSGQRAMATNLGGKARAGSPPTRTSQLTAALKASIKGGEATGRFWDVGKKRPVLRVGVGARAAMTRVFNRGMKEGPW